VWDGHSWHAVLIVSGHWFDFVMLVVKLVWMFLCIMGRVLVRFWEHHFCLISSCLLEFLLEQYIYPPSTSFPSAMSPYTACAPAPGLVYRLAP
jgi:hypothetical protein